MKPEAYVQRDYRRAFGAKLHYFNVCVEQTDLKIGACREERVRALQWVKEARAQVQTAIALCPAFLTSFEPVNMAQPLPDTARWMAEAARVAGTGPMAAVAGAVARYVGQRLHADSPEVLVENGGDLYIASAQPRTVGIFAGESPLSMKVGIRLDAGEWGVATSSGRIGPSVSFGAADAAVVVAHDAALADAAATALGNLLHSARDIPSALERICALPGITGAAAVMNDQIGAAGGIALTAMQGERK
ncbi:MAG: UPF0280 family protein [Eubacteriales bacterium]|nr:UPF0280 family protein [Eubacteriales bacterium]